MSWGQTKHVMIARTLVAIQDCTPVLMVLMRKIGEIVKVGVLKKQKKRQKIVVVNLVQQQRKRIHGLRMRQNTMRKNLSALKTTTELWAIQYLVNRRYQMNPFIFLAKV